MSVLCVWVLAGLFSVSSLSAPLSTHLSMVGSSTPPSQHTWLSLIISDSFRKPQFLWLSVTRLKSTASLWAECLSVCLSVFVVPVQVSGVWQPSWGKSSASAAPRSPSLPDYHKKNPTHFMLRNNLPAVLSILLTLSAHRFMSLSLLVRKKESIYTHTHTH